MLAFSCFCLVVGDMLFGFVSNMLCLPMFSCANKQDTGSFGGILAMPVSSAPAIGSELYPSKTPVNWTVDEGFEPFCPFAQVND